MEVFIAQTKQKLDNVMKTLEWDLETLKKHCPVSVCRYDDKHHVQSNQLVKHELHCYLLKQGLNKNEAALVQDTGFCYEESPLVTSFSITEQEKKNVLISRCVGDRYEIGGVDVNRPLNPEERLALYEHIIEKVRCQNKHHKIPDEQLMFMDDGHEEKVKKEGLTLAKLRDLKRRRPTYRAKNVHVTKKSYTMVMREVLENQFKILEQRLKDEAEMREELVKNVQTGQSREADDGSVRSGRESVAREAKSRSAKASAGGRESHSRDTSRSKEESRTREAWRPAPDNERWPHDRYDDRRSTPAVQSRIEEPRDRRDSHDNVSDYHGFEKASFRDYARRDEDDLPNKSRGPSKDSEKLRDREVSNDYEDANSRSRESDRARSRDRVNEFDMSRGRGGERERHDSSRGTRRFDDRCVMTSSSSRYEHSEKHSHDHESSRDRTPRAHHSRDQRRSVSEIELHYDDEESTNDRSRSKHGSRSRSESRRSRSKRRKSRESKKSRDRSTKRKSAKKSRKRKRSPSEKDSSKHKSKRRHKHKHKKKKKKTKTAEESTSREERPDSDDVVSDPDIASDGTDEDDFDDSDAVEESEPEEGSSPESEEEVDNESELEKELSEPSLSPSD